ncbi:MAG: DUF5103 domain-containing protein [Balneolaceae bacterium]|nr:DUF5103 domain-containing protein [Balneolaceae bacterium]
MQSIQLHRKGTPNSPPVIVLDKSDEALVLEFDHLDSASKQFKASVRHYSQEWQESSLSLNFYMDGFYEDYFGGGSKSYVQRPTYRHYEYEFPNDQLSMTVSGNYLLTITDPNTGEHLFTLPFFISENKGELETQIKTEFVRREDLRELDRPFSEFRYPGFVEMPQFDLSFTYVQNQFWGRARKVKNFDTSTPGFVNFHLSQEEGFLGDYEFNTLDIRSFAASERIISYQPETTPPTLILRRDLQNFSSTPSFFGGSRFGQPIDERSAEYANVIFQLDPALAADSLQQLYLVGDFNNWTINSLNKMELDSTSGLWKGSAFIKQGEYAYKYILVEENYINDLALDQSFSYRQQQYLTLVYFRDPVRHYDRLLKVDITEQ